MKALTICQPYASLIARGEKRVENRTWPTSYRGRLYIHAGKSREWLSSDVDEEGENYGIPLAQMPFGAVVAVATLADCVHIDKVGKGMTGQRWPWLAEHEHTSGPWCWILANVTPIGPWPWRGAQGLFDIDDEELDRAANRQLGITAETVSAP